MLLFFSHFLEGFNSASHYAILIIYLRYFTLLLLHFIISRFVTSYIHLLVFFPFPTYYFPFSLSLPSFLHSCTSAFNNFPFLNLFAYLTSPAFFPFSCYLFFLTRPIELNHLFPWFSSLYIRIISPLFYSRLLSFTSLFFFLLFPLYPYSFPFPLRSPSLISILLFLVLFLPLYPYSFPFPLHSPSFLSLSPVPLPPRILLPRSKTQHKIHYHVNWLSSTWLGATPGRLITLVPPSPFHLSSASSPHLSDPESEYRPNPSLLRSFLLPLRKHADIYCFTSSVLFVL